MIITSHDIAFSSVDRPELLRVKDLSYQDQFVKKKGYVTKIHYYDKYIVDAKGYFLSGFLPRIEKYCRENNIPFETQNNIIKKPIPENVSALFTLRIDQEEMVQSGLDIGRGVLKAPTGTGKTVLISAMISAYPGIKILFLCHKTSLLLQTKEEFNNYKLGKTTIVNAQSKNLEGQIVISTIQSFSKDKILDETFDKFGAIFVDECHACSSTDGLYAKVLTKMTSPIRIGLTATLPTTEKAQFALEGLIGPVIGELSLEEAIEKEILAIPRIKLVPVPTCQALRDVRIYADTQEKDVNNASILDDLGNPIIKKGIYSIGIVEYRKRNRIIMEICQQEIEKKHSIIVYIIRLDHGERLLEMAQLLGIQAVFVRGETSVAEKEKIRKALEAKEIMLVIASVTWSEGINIRSLNTIFIAGGGKSEKDLIQKVGRGLRRTDEKFEATIYVMLDNGKYLSQHCVEQLKIFVEKGWL